MPLPDRMSFIEGAAVPVGWLTAWHALVTVGNAQPGQTVLVESIASSVGSAALDVHRPWLCFIARSIMPRDPHDNVRRAPASDWRPHNAVRAIRA